MTGWDGGKLSTATIQTWHGGRLPVGAGKGATMGTARTGSDWQEASWRPICPHCGTAHHLGVTCPSVSSAGALWEAGADWGRMTLEHQPPPDDELAALRAAVARLEGELTQAKREAYDQGERQASATERRHAAWRLRRERSRLIAERAAVARLEGEAEQADELLAKYEARTALADELVRLIQRIGVLEDGTDDDRWRAIPLHGRVAELCGEYETTYLGGPEVRDGE